MARVTVEDCVDKVPNRFDLVMLAAHRAREINTGSPLSIERDNDKNPVVALREIAEETQQIDDLRERMIESSQTRSRLMNPKKTPWRCFWVPKLTVPSPPMKNRKNGCCG